MEHIQTAMLKSGISRRAAWAPRIGPAERTASDTPWETLPLAIVEPAHLEANRIVAAGRSDPAQGAFDMLRTRVLHHLRENGWTSVAITSPTPGGGKSAVALNLAFSLANRADCRTVLLDLDLRRPRIASALGMRDAPAIETYLHGQAGLERAFRRIRPNLAVAPNCRPVDLAAELLQGPETARTIGHMKQQLNPDVILCDMPPMLANDDLMAFLPNVDCVILIVEAERNTLDEVDGCERELSLKSNVLGIVLNKCRHEGETTAYRYGG